MNEKQKLPRIEGTQSAGRLMIVSNRLPVVLSRQAEGEGWSSTTGSGGLVSALMPVLRDRGGVWIGWPGVSGEARSIDAYLQNVSGDAGFSLEGVHLSEEEVQGFYAGFSNEIVWPLFHDLPVDCYFDPAHWRAYQRVNRKFAEAIANSRRPDDVIWIHDYHLMGVAADLRRRGITNKVGFFLHIPFPAPDLFLKLPWRDEILSGLLQYDLVGFQTMRDCRNFQRCLKALYRVRIKGKGQVKELQATLVDKGAGKIETKRLRIGSFPISIDFDHHAKLVKRDEVVNKAKELAQAFGKCHRILSVDRLDYTKGLLAKLRAFRIAIKRYPELRENIVLSLHVVPSRERIRQYRQLRAELEQLISEINGMWSRPGWIPVHYYYHSLTPVELAAYYRSADIMLVSPLKDGMNLVAKEFCASRPEENGVLVLSEFAGAAAELQEGALLINPYDDEGTAERIFEATSLPRAEIVWRMRRMRQKLGHHNIYHWVNVYLGALAGRDLADFPEIGDYVPGSPLVAHVINA